MLAFGSGNVHLNASSSLHVPSISRAAGCTSDAGRDEAYVTLVGSRRADASFHGLRVLVHTIRKHDACRPFIALVANGAGAQRISHAVDCELAALGVRTVRVPLLTSTVKQCLQTLRLWAGNNTNTARYAFTVFNAWRLVQFKRVIWLEPDQMLLRPLNELWTMHLDNEFVGAAAMVMEYMPLCGPGIKGRASMRRRRLKFNAVSARAARIFVPRLAKTCVNVPANRSFVLTAS